MPALRAPALVALLAGAALAGCLQAAPPAAPLAPAAVAVPDPVGLGALAVRLLDYDFGVELFEDGRGATFPLHVRGSLHVPEGPGPYPVLVLVHGYHGTCSYPLLPQLPWYWGNSTIGPYGNCPDAGPVVEPAESFRGYDYLSGPLAGHGYAIASVDANELNDNFLAYDWTVRAQLALRTLDHLREAHAGGREDEAGRAVEGKLDLARVGLMGHSRGGQGVATAAVLNAQREPAERHGIVAVLGLAPVDAASESSVVADAAYATLLPYCDGDVWSLHGARTFDRARYLDEASPSPKYQWLVMGSNHNFYNTVWANNADDASWMTDAHCGVPAPEGGKLGLEDTLRHGAALMAAFFRAYAGGEAAFLPLLRGDAPLPPEGCPRVAVDCAGVFHASVHPPVGDRLAVEDARTAAALHRNDLGGASRFEGFAEAAWCQPADCPGPTNTALAPQLHLAWDGPAAWTAEVPGHLGDVAAYGYLSLRAAVVHGDARNPAGEDQDFRVVLTDAYGRAASVRLGEHTRALYSPPGSDPGPDDGSGLPLPAVQPDTAANARTVLNEARVPLAAFRGVDLRSVASVALVFDTTPSGALLVADLLLAR